jgi:hypothetical protein
MLWRILVRVNKKLLREEQDPDSRYTQMFGCYQVSLKYKAVAKVFST